ncbi:hypothetical protein K440DRAFT_622512 [Wilcoxina mikolae CBS 423.85]|nr:hypothetical protein K440DRAFT_622512 [Wilcoxina mikolae CBS 423.85]
MKTLLSLCFRQAHFVSHILPLSAPLASGGDKATERIPSEADLGHATRHYRRDDLRKLLPRCDRRTTSSQLRDDHGGYPRPTLGPTSSRPGRRGKQEVAALNGDNSTSSYALRAPQRRQPPNLGRPEPRGYHRRGGAQG